MQTGCEGHSKRKLEGQVSLSTARVKVPSVLMLDALCEPFMPARGSTCKSRLGTKVVVGGSMGLLLLLVKRVVSFFFASFLRHAVFVTSN